MKHSDTWHRPKPKKRSETFTIFNPDGTQEFLELTEDLSGHESQKEGRQHSQDKRTANAKARYREYQVAVDKLRDRWPQLSHWALSGIVADEFDVDRITVRRNTKY